MAGVGCGDSPVAWLRIALITMPNPFRLTRLLPASVSLRSALGLMLGVASAYGAEIAPPALRAVDFDQEIRPLLENHCTDCHDGEKQKGQLRLDGVAGILKGGDSGEPLLIRGKSLESNIIRHVTSKNPKEVMPPKGDPLTLEEIGLLRAWIDAGAKMPGEAEAAQSLKLKTDHWSFQPLKRPAVPQGGDGFVRNAVDGFVLAKLKEKTASSRMTSPSSSVKNPLAASPDTACSTGTDWPWGSARMILRSVKPSPLSKSKRGEASAVKVRPVSSITRFASLGNSICGRKRKATAAKATANSSVNAEARKNDCRVNVMEQTMILA